MVLITKDFFSIKLHKNYKKGEKVSFTEELEMLYIESGCAKKITDKKTKEKKFHLLKKLISFI
tara:strand:+ start:800 stop:988 length:189 start_codon:yes stop_codon:yes gene_type:complete